MKKIELECSNCGAIMQVSNDKTEASCPYCKNKILLEKAPTLEEISIREEQISYAKKSGENKADEEFVIRKKKRKIKTTIIICVIMISIIVILGKISFLSLEYMNDPFTCIDVNFLGSDGAGTMEIVDNKTCEGFIDIKYTATKKSELKENEKIRISVSSERYRFGKTTKEYIVSGLSLYLKNLDDLTDDMLTKLHKYSYEYLNNNTFGMSFTGEVQYLTPYKLYLYTKGENENVLFDVYKVGIKTKSGNVYEKYLVAGYEDFILLNNDQLFSYSRLNNRGNVIEAGDPNESSAFGDNYAGFLTGYLTIAEFENYLYSDNDGTVKIMQK